MKKMVGDGFIIMQIGDPDMDRVCDEVFHPAIEECDLVPRRVDRDNGGELLKAEIVDFLERAQIIVADLTNERPNCYLEVGYAMGLGKKANLILCVRQDHHHRDKSYKLDGPRVHFDLEGYDLLLWDPEKLDEFKDELVKRIKRRLAILEPPRNQEPSLLGQGGSPVTDADWVRAQHAKAIAGLEAVGLSGYMEASVALKPKGAWPQQTVRSTIERSQIHTFGWPIGIVMNRDGYQPKPTSDGVRAEVAFTDEESAMGRASYDYWYMRRSGEFYLLQGLFEDTRSPNSLFFDTRIVRVTELLMFLARCYTELGVADDTQLQIDLTHGGLEGRELGAAGNRSIFMSRRTSEALVTAQTSCTVGELQSRLVENVRALLEPLFVVFDFFSIDTPIWEQIVNDFVEGKIQ